MRQILRHLSHSVLGGFLVIQGILAVLTPAQADVVTFALRGTFSDGEVLSGLMTVDRTLGEATDLLLFADGFKMTDIVTQPSEDNQFTLVAATDDGKAQAFLDFVISFIGYTSGALALDSHVVNLAADPPTRTFLLIGTVQPTSATAPPPSVPEPSTWALMLVGFAGVGVFTIRRARKATVAIA